MLAFFSPLVSELIHVHALGVFCLSFTCKAAAVFQHGSVVAIMNFPIEFYTDGVYSDDTCNGQCTGATKANGACLAHAVTVVGFGTEMSTAYWIVKNSFSFAWGDRGYFRIKRGTDVCGIESNAVVPIAAS